MMLTSSNQFSKTFLKQLSNLYKFMLIDRRHGFEIFQGKIEGHK